MAVTNLFVQDVGTLVTICGEAVYSVCSVCSVSDDEESDYHVE